MSSRINRVNELIRTTIAEIISREIELPLGVFVTVVKVDTSRDLRYARVFVSVFPEKKFGKTMEFLQKKIIYDPRGSEQKTPYEAAAENRICPTNGSGSGQD